jgi:conjugal transfer mating pair stabilization protein TraN
LPGYQANLPQQNYYQGIIQENTNLESDGKKALSEQESAKAVDESFRNRPYFQINSSSEAMQKLHTIADKSDAIMHGENTNTTTCSLKPKQCQYLWQEKTCITKKSDAINNCTTLIEQDCEQKASVCLLSTTDHCEEYKQTYLCPENKCTDNELVCGSESFCLDGNCNNPTSVPADENEFKKGMSALSAVSDASSSFNEKRNIIFQGQRMECSMDFAGAKNCCRDSGWGIDLNLMHCKDGEKVLGKSKEKKLTVATGIYCAKRKKFPGGSICVSKHKTYCVFSSKLARIVQEQGRRNQLGIGFGNGNSTNCSGITPEQMQLIQFERIDFSEFYEDVQHKINHPDQQKTTSAISQRVQDFYNQGIAHE